MSMSMSLWSEKMGQGLSYWQICQSDGKHTQQEEQDQERPAISDGKHTALSQKHAEEQDKYADQTLTNFYVEETSQRSQTNLSLMAMGK